MYYASTQCHVKVIIQEHEGTLRVSNPQWELVSPIDTCIVGWETSHSLESRQERQGPV